MKKYNRITWKSTGKTLRAMAKDKAVQLKDNRSLFAQMIILVCKEGPEQ